VVERDFLFDVCRIKIETSFIQHHPIVWELKEIGEWFSGSCGVTIDKEGASPG
jgi:hypothetical protein